MGNKEDGSSMEELQDLKLPPLPRVTKPAPLMYPLLPPHALKKRRHNEKRVATRTPEKYLKKSQDYFERVALNNAARICSSFKLRESIKFIDFDLQASQQRPAKQLEKSIRLDLDTASAFLYDEHITVPTSSIAYAKLNGKDIAIPSQIVYCYFDELCAGLNDFMSS